MAEHRYDSSKGEKPLIQIDTYVPPVVQPPPWPRLAPDLLDIDLTGPRSIIAMSDTNGGPKTGGAKWLDPSIKGISGTGDPAYDNTGQVFHYSNLAGIYIPARGPACDMRNGWTNWDCKFTSWDSGPDPRWGVEPSIGLHYLECGTDGSKEPQPQVGCQTCRTIDWKAGGINVKEIYWREVFWAAQNAWDNQTEIGVKLTGVGGVRADGGTFAEIFELGKKNPATGGWFLQSYRYDGEGDMHADVFPNVDIQPLRYYVMEGHVKVPTTVTIEGKDANNKTIFGGSKDGVLEFKVNGVPVWGRSDINMGANGVQGCNVLRFHGGKIRPAGPMTYRIGAIALSRKGWIGPPLGWV